MARRKTAQTAFNELEYVVNLYRKGQATFAEVQSKYTRVAKSIDEQMKSIERMGKSDPYSAMKQYQYRKTQRELRLLNGDGGKAQRFNRKLTNNMNAINARMAKMQEWLDSDTNTKTKVRQLYESNAEKFNETMRTKAKAEGREWVDLTWQDLQRFFNSPEYSKIMDRKLDKYGAFIAIDSIKADKIRQAETIDDQRKNSKTVFSDSPSSEVAKMLLREGLLDDFKKKM